jgi:hypothetical protein
LIFNKINIHILIIKDYVIIKLMINLVIQKCVKELISIMEILDNMYVVINIIVIIIIVLLVIIVIIIMNILQDKNKRNIMIMDYIVLLWLILD